jgi:replicative superfamily II helicase
VVRVTKPEELRAAESLMTDAVDPLLSALHMGSGRGLEKLLLEMICVGRLSREEQVAEFIACTLMSIQQPEKEVKQWVTAAVSFLREGQFILASSTGELLPSQLGKATSLSGTTLLLYYGPYIFISINYACVL